MRIGVHVSIAGGIEEAPERGHKLGCEAIQVFTKSNLQWAAQDITLGQYDRFRALCSQFGLGPNIGHACYLLNLATPEEALFERSVRTLTLEARRAHEMRLCCLSFHPGAHLGSGVDQGVRRVAEGLRRVIDDTRDCEIRIAIETTAGSGTALGSRFEELAEMIDRTGGSDRIGVCFDTCHVFAAGYELRTLRGCQETLAAFDRIIGLARLFAFHLNDSKGVRGSKLDRHEHIGQGQLGEATFRRLLRDRRFRDVPGVLETPKKMRGRTHWDVINMATLRRLRGSPSA